MKKHILLFTLLALIATPIFAKSNPCDGTQQNPCVVLDTQHNTNILRKWRTAPEMALIYKGDTAGLSTLWESGSAAFSANGFKTIADNIQKITQGKVKTIVDVDLRQESHGYLNNDAITLAAKNDWINKGKTDLEALAAEHNWLDSVKKQVSVFVLTPKQFNKGDFSQGISVPVQQVDSEEVMAKKNGFQYFRLMVTDHLPPNDNSIDKFVTLVDSLPLNTWLHIHCRGGAGRTTTFMAMYDMLKNARVVSFNEIIKRQDSVPPYYNLLQIERKNPELSAFYRQRLQFLKEFYQFSKTHKPSSVNWSTWRQHL